MYKPLISYNPLGGSSVRIEYRSSAIFDVNIFVLLVTMFKITGPINRFQLAHIATIGSPSVIASNLGVDANYFGHPLTGAYCIQGFDSMRMNCRDGKGLVVSFLFNMNGSSVTGIISSNIIEAKLETVCFGVPKVCPSNCNSCPNATECSLCNPNFYLRQDKLCYSTCLAGYYQNATTGTCDSCPSICY